MDDEIDIQRYILLLVNKWKTIAAFVVILAGIGYFYTAEFVSPVFEARALIVVTQPRYDLNFDPRFRTETDTSLDLYRPLNNLAVSDELLIRLLLELEGESSIFSEDINSLRKMLMVDSEGVPNLIQLVVTGENPQETTVIANTWAELFIVQANLLYGESDDQNSLSLNLASVGAERAAAEQALIAFQSENTLVALNAELMAIENSFTQVYTTQNVLKEDALIIASFIDQLRALPPGDNLSSQDSATLLLVQIKAFNVQEDGLSIDLSPQQSADVFTNRESIVYLETLLTTLETKGQKIELEISPLIDRLAVVQTRILELETKETRLNQDFTIVEETHLTLARKYAESQVSAQVSNGTIQLASRPSVPVNPVGPKVLLNTLLGAIIGAVIGLAWVLGEDFWKNVNRGEG